MNPGQSPEQTGPPPAPAEVEGDSSMEAGEESDGFRLRISKDRMRVSLDCNTEGRNIEELAAAVLERLSKFHLSRPPTIDRLQASIRQAAAESARFDGAEILIGTLPKQPVDGRIDWSAVQIPLIRRRGRSDRTDREGRGAVGKDAATGGLGGIDNRRRHRRSAFQGHRKGDIRTGGATLMHLDSQDVVPFH